MVRSGVKLMVYAVDVPAVTMAGKSLVTTDAAAADADAAAATADADALDA
jgi:hypothetical protein